MTRPAPRRPLRLLLVYQTLAPQAMGGIEQRNLGLATALAARGHQVAMAGFGEAWDGGPAGVERRLLGPAQALWDGASGKRGGRREVGYAAAVARLPLAGYDLVETANMPYAHLPALAARCRLAGAPLLVTWYEHWGRYWREYSGRLAGAVLRRFEAVTARLGTAVAATSELTRARLARQRRGGVELLPCGVDVAAIRAVAAQAAAGPAPQAGAPLLFAGRLLAHKRLDVLLSALASPQLAAAPPGPLLDVFGDGPERPRLERLAAELGIAARVRFRGQASLVTAVWVALGSARVAVQPSAREGFGLFPLEAMAAGVPVVYCTSPESALPELVRDGREGSSAPPEPAALAGALARLLRDEPLRRELGEGAARRAAGLDWSVVASRFEGLAEQLVAAAPARPGTVAPASTR